MGCVSTAHDLFRFAEMLRRGGELEGVRILSPATVDARHLGPDGRDGQRVPRSDPGAARTATATGEYRAGFPHPRRRSCLNSMGTLTSPRTFGKFGLGGTGFWVDPERDVTFVFLRSGLLEHVNDTASYQRLSDMAIAAAI